MKKISLDIPADAREFLSEFKIEGKKVTGVEVTSGKWIEFADMDDSQIVFYAKEIYFEILGGKEGVDQIVNTDLDLGNH